MPIKVGTLGEVNCVCNLNYEDLLYSTQLSLENKSVLLIQPRGNSKAQHCCRKFNCGMNKVYIAVQKGHLGTLPVKIPLNLLYLAVLPYEMQHP